MGCSTCVSCKGTAVLQSDPDKSLEKELGYMPMSKDVTSVNGDNSFYFDGRCFFLVGKRDDEDYNDGRGGQYKKWVTVDRPCREIRWYFKEDIDEIKRKLKRKWKKLIDAEPYVDGSLKGLWGRFRKAKQYPIIWLYLATHKKELDAARGAGSRTLIYTKGEVEPEVLETLWEKRWDAHKKEYVYYDIDDFEKNVGIPFDQKEYDRAVKFVKENPMTVTVAGRAYKKKGISRPRPNLQR